MDVGVLGSLEIEIDGGRVGLNSAVQRRILSALVVRRGEVVAPERLAEMAGVSLRALRTAISRIRAGVDEQLIVTRSEGYTLGSVAVDADRFEELLDEARRTAPGDAVDVLDSALRLWRGSPYAECVDTEWAPPVVARLTELWSAAIEDRGEALMIVGRYADAAAAMAAHARRHHLRDRPVELLMRALAAQGRQTEALREFRDHRRRLIEEFGVEPGAELVELDARIARGWHDTSTAAADSSAEGSDEVGGNLLRPLTSFLGRQREIGEVIHDVGQHRLVTLTGVGGVGKTRLAIESALESGRWSDGVWLVELASVGHGGDVADAVARTFGIRQTPGLDSSESVIRWCRSREMLLILDNCEHVLHHSAQLAEALAGATDFVTVLATSREPLMVPGEHVRPVSPLALPGQEIRSDGAVELFVDRARAELPSFDPDRHRSAIENICRRLDGLPLALELAAARVRGLSAEDIASRLDERFRLLTGGRRTAIDRHATLRATVDWSYDMLSETERQVLRSISVFAGPFTLDDAIAVAGDDLGELDAVDAVAHLADRSLVVRVDAAPEYRLLETLRAYGREQLEVADEADRIGRRHVELMARKAAAARVEAAGPPENDVVATLRAQFADYGMAVTCASDRGDADMAVRIAEDLNLSVMRWDGNGGSGPWMCALLGTEFSDRRVAAANRWMAGLWHLFFGNDVGRAITLATEAVELDPSCAMAHFVLTIGALFTGRPGDAVLVAESAQGLERDASERQFLLMALGNALLLSGELDEATRVAGEFVTWAEGAQFPTAMAMAYHLEGRTLAERDSTRARESFERGLEVVRERIPGCWVVEINLQREMIPLLYRSNPRDASALAMTVLRECVRHNETGNLLSSLAYAAIMLVDGGLDDLAATAIGAAGPVVLAPRDAKIYEQRTSSLRHRLGPRCEPLVAEGSRVPVLEIAQRVLDGLSSR